MPRAADAAVSGRRLAHLYPRSSTGSRSRHDRLAVSITIQVVGEILGRVVSLLRLLGQAFQADGLEVACHPRQESRRGDRVVVDDLAEVSIGVVP